MAAKKKKKAKASSRKPAKRAKARKPKAPKKKPRAARKPAKRRAPRKPAARKARQRARRPADPNWARELVATAPPSIQAKHPRAEVQPAWWRRSEAFRMRKVRRLAGGTAREKCAALALARAEVRHHPPKKKTRRAA